MGGGGVGGGWGWGGGVGGGGGGGGGGLGSEEVFFHRIGFQQIFLPLLHIVYVAISQN